MEIARRALSHAASCTFAALAAVAQGCSLIYPMDGYDDGIDAPALAYTAEITADAPLAYWRLGEAEGVTAVDLAGGFDGTYQSVKLGVPGALSGDPDTAARFDGTTSVVLAGDVLDLAGGMAFSLEAWVKPDGVDSVYRRVFTKQRLEGGLETGWSMSHSTEKHLVLETYGAGLRAGGVSPEILPDGVFSHVVVTYDTGTLRFYVNGVRVSQFSEAIDLTDNDANLSLGSLSSADGNFWRGDLDEMAIYGHALSADRVAAHHRAAIAR